MSVVLTLGPHKVRFELADPTHEVITSNTINKVTNYGGSILIPPRTLPQGEQMAILRDPMGLTFGVMRTKI
jgi:predicted enzyme related to lactoylglutathione lyase